MTGSLKVKSSLFGYTFVFSPATSDAEQQLIKDAVVWAYFFYKSVQEPGLLAGNTISTDASPTCETNVGHAGLAGPGSITICVSNAGWTSRSATMRQEFVAHEMTHMWEWQKSWYEGAATPEWFLEGTAENFAYNALDRGGAMIYATALMCAAKQVADFTRQRGAPMPTLDQLESAAAYYGSTIPRDAYALLAVDQLRATTTVGYGT